MQSNTDRESWSGEQPHDHMPGPKVTHVDDYDRPDNVIVVYDEENLEAWITCDPWHVQRLDGGAR